MNWPLFFSWRYLFSRKSHHIINLISAISAVGISVATAALVCTLSVFNGFQELVAGLFTSFDPQLKITLNQGQIISSEDSIFTLLESSPSVQLITPVLEGQALVVCGEHQSVATIKGVAENYSQQVSIEEVLLGDGDYVLQHEGRDYGILGIQLASNLGLGFSFEDSLQVYAPKRGERIQLTNPLSSFNCQSLYSPGVLLAMNQAKYDAHYILTSLTYARRLFDQPDGVSAIEVRLHEGENVDVQKGYLQNLIGPRFRIQNRYEQQEDVFRIMRIEKLISYLFLTFILLVACFNIIGSLSMLMIEKKNDVYTLRCLGATSTQISRIFMYEGALISTLGALLGLALGSFLCFLQHRYGLITLGENFIVEAYPVSVHGTDLGLILLTVVLVGWLSVWYPINYLSRKLLKK